VTKDVDHHQRSGDAGKIKGTEFAKVRRSVCSRVDALVVEILTEIGHDGQGDAEGNGMSKASSCGRRCNAQDRGKQQRPTSASDQRGNRNQNRHQRHNKSCTIGYIVVFGRHSTVFVGQQRRLLRACRRRGRTSASSFANLIGCRIDQQRLLLPIRSHLFGMTFRVEKSPLHC